MKEDKNFIVTINCLTIEQALRIYDKTEGTIKCMGKNIKYEIINHDVIIYIPKELNLMPIIVYNKNQDSMSYIREEVGIEINISYNGDPIILRKIETIIRAQFKLNDDDHYKSGDITIDSYNNSNNNLNSLTIYINNKLAIEPVLVLLPHGIDTDL